MTLYANVTDAYLGELQVTLTGPEFRNAPRGHHSAERIGVSFAIEDPRDRLVRKLARRANLPFCLAEVLWYLSGRNDLEMISFYAPTIAQYSADGQTLAGTAYGPRIFRFNDRLDQWTSIKRQIAADPDTKRAVIQIFDSPEATDVSNIDVACTLALQYFLREGRLHAVSFMRANDAFRGAVSDLFAFTFIQEFLACELNVELGRYTHFAGSYHIYEPDRRRASETADAEGLLSGDYPKMPTGSQWPSLWRVTEIEAAVRQDPSRVSRRELDELDGYWSAVARVFCIHAAIQHKSRLDPDWFHQLPSLFRASLVTRWPAWLASTG